MIEPLNWLTEMYDTRPGLLVGLAVFVIVSLAFAVWLNRHLKGK